MPEEFIHDPVTIQVQSKVRRPHRNRSPIADSESKKKAADYHGQSAYDLLPVCMGEILERLNGFRRDRGRLSDLKAVSSELTSHPRSFPVYSNDDQ
jgi:hypothetical protein